VSSAPALTEKDEEVFASPSNLRRWALWGAGVLLAAANAVLITLLAISTATGGEVSVLIGALGSDRIGGLALTAALASLTLGLCRIPVPRLWLLLMIPARLAAIAAVCLSCFFWVLTSSMTVVALVSGGCETGYVVEEESFLLSGSGTVYRRDGIFVTAVDHTVGDDGYHPFADGAYVVVDDGDALRVWYSISFDPSAAPLSTGADPAFTLPKLTDQAHRCDISAGTREPSATPSTAAAYTADEARDGVMEILDVSLGAVVGAVRDTAGDPIDPLQLETVTTPCGDNGTRVGVAVEFTTEDNATSLAQVLRVWDSAGYSPDRAMQEDIRSSDTLPIAKMSIRDSTTIDGLIHMTITSQCGMGK
jgi:hypothetical protein